MGTIKYVTGYKQFSNVAAEQKGNFFPLHIEKIGSTLTIKKNGSTIRDHIEFDPEIVLRVSASDKFEILVDDEPVVTLNFAKATLLKN